MIKTEKPPFSNVWITELYRLLANSGKITKDGIWKTSKTSFSLNAWVLEFRYISCLPEANDSFYSTITNKYLAIKSGQLIYKWDIIDIYLFLLKGSNWISTAFCSSSIFSLTSSSFSWIIIDLWFYRKFCGKLAPELFMIYTHEYFSFSSILSVTFTKHLS